jgi:hypothetical protein
MRRTKPRGKSPCANNGTRAQGLIDQRAMHGVRHVFCVPDESGPSPSLTACFFVAHESQFIF